MTAERDRVAAQSERRMPARRRKRAPAPGKRPPGLVLSETDTGAWLQLEGETSEERARLEALAALGIWTCGPGTDDVRLRLRALAGEVAPGFRHEWGGSEPSVRPDECLREWPGEEGGR